MGLWNEILMKLGLKKRPLVNRGSDRRKDNRRWTGAENEKPHALHDPRRKKERRKKSRRRKA